MEKRIAIVNDSQQMRSIDSNVPLRKRQQRLPFSVKNNFNGNLINNEEEIRKIAQESISISPYLSNYQNERFISSPSNIIREKESILPKYLVVKNDPKHFHKNINNDNDQQNGDQFKQQPQRKIETPTKLPFPKVNYSFKLNFLLHNGKFYFIL